jgi:ssDNA-binding Zn-finger/Zn-ribbon topoisomerase 1
MVVRTAERGRYAGQQFYGCVNYPQCRITRSVADA